ncbi:MAG: hypothetical protein KGL53_13575, partial [Elusimicrobia bacterium]|nr:hypothetical protein [Elusimicrobiota bacterium]
IVVRDPFARERLIEDLRRSAVSLALSSACDADHAVELLGGSVPDCLLVDADGMGQGLAPLLSSLAEDAAWRRLPVFVLTGGRALPESAASLAALRTLSSPFQLSEFLAALGRSDGDLKA